MANVHKGGRKRIENRKRFPSGQLQPVVNDFGTAEQRLKRDIANGTRGLHETRALLSALQRLEAANISQALIQQVAIQKAAVKDQVLNQAELESVLTFLATPPARNGMSVVDVLLSRQIIDRDQFDVAADFVACWCAYIGRPWPVGWSAERGSPDYNGGISEAALSRMKIRYWNCVSALDQVDKALYPLISDVVVYGKFAGLPASILEHDVIRVDGEQRRR